MATCFSGFRIALGIIPSLALGLLICTMGLSNLVTVPPAGTASLKMV